MGEYTENSIFNSDIKYKWKYAGSDTDIAFFKKISNSDEIPEHEDYCICGKKIIENFYIYNNVTNLFAVIGYCCGWLYNDLITKNNLCEKCGESINNYDKCFCLKKHSKNHRKKHRNRYSTKYNGKII